MEPEAIKLITDSLNVNYVDMEEYPSSTEIQNRCVAMLADLYHADKEAEATGTACVGSSEAIMLAGLAMKRQWQARRKAEGKGTDRPNLVMGYNVQVCWEKFCRYFDVEERFVALTEDCFVMTPEKAAKLVDEHTIGVCGIMGSTYTGDFEDIEGLDREIGKINKEHGWNVPIHVDAASGGFVAPFLRPELKWDFRLDNVKSINVSGHKYGLVYPGVGWVIFRNKAALPEDLVFHVNYLGSDQPNFTLNFSKGASHIIAQYYQFLRLGKEGYTKIMMNLRNVSIRLTNGLVKTGHFKILNKEDALPLVAFSFTKRLDEDGTEHARAYDEFDLADRLRMRGWVLPAYTMAPNAGSVKLLRVTIREDFSMGMADELVADIGRAIEYLDHHYTFNDTQLLALKKSFGITRMDSEIYNKKKQNGVC
jgi:glutamate decarboxylase